MNREDIIRMAREAHLELVTKDYPGHTGTLDPWTMRLLERFAPLVAAHVLTKPCCQDFDKCQQACMPRAAAAEREACARVCEELAARDKLSNYYAVAAKAIRARGQDPMSLFDDWGGIPYKSCPPCNQQCNQGRDCPNA